MFSVEELLLVFDLFVDFRYLLYILPDARKKTVSDPDCFKVNSLQIRANYMQCTVISNTKVTRPKALIRSLYSDITYIHVIGTSFRGVTSDDSVFSETLNYTRIVRLYLASACGVSGLD